MTDFQIKYAIRSLMTGSHQDDVDTQLRRASIVESKNDRRQNHGMDIPTR